jgi:hypothetical protein
MKFCVAVDKKYINNMQIIYYSYVNNYVKAMVQVFEVVLQ